jgi:hypothetical protein
MLPEIALRTRESEDTAWGGEQLQRDSARLEHCGAAEQRV